MIIKNLKITIGRILFAAVMVFIIAAFALYQQGYYDIVFIDRETESQVTDVPDVIGVPETTSEEINQNENVIENEPVDDTSEAESEEPESNPVTQPTQNEPSYKELTAKIESSKNYLSSDWNISDKVYKSNTHKITSFTLPVTVEKIYSYTNENYSVSVYNEETGETEIAQKSRRLPLIRSYLGYLLINNASHQTSLYNPAKNIINRDLVNFAPAYLRDMTGKPLFIYENGYYTINTDSRLAPVTDIDINLFSGLEGFYPNNTGTTGLYLYYEERPISRLINGIQVEAAANRGEYLAPIYVDDVSRLYGYKNSVGNIIIPARYLYAFDFTDTGLAVVADRNRAVSVINTYGNTVISVQNMTLRIPELSARAIYDGYYLPKELTTANRGMFYFDNGLLRVRRVITQSNTLQTKLKDTDVLIRFDGSIFDIPPGYEIVYYSDGVAVLKSGDLYGCFSNTGKWIAQPIYTYAGSFNEGLIVLGNRDGKKGMIDTSGNTVLPFVFDEISDVSGGVIAAYEKENGWSIYLKIARREG
jgi:hypothetical protein